MLMLAHFLRLLITLIAVGAPLTAATWIGTGVSDTWSDPGNWAEGVPPGADDEAVFAAATSRPAVNDLPAVRAVVVSAGNVHLVGAELTAQTIDVRAGVATLALPLRVAALRVAANARLDLQGPLTIAGDRLQVLVEGELQSTGSIAGNGTVEVAGRGVMTLAGRSTWHGGLQLRQATLRLAAEVPASGPGALGEGDAPLGISEATLVLASAAMARPIAILSGRATLRAEGTARTLAAPIRMLGGETAKGSLVGTYLRGSRRNVVADDWRTAGPTPDRQRGDANIAFGSSAFGTAAERRQWRIAGDDGNWDDFAVQWDGWITVGAAGTCLYTCSDDGSRVWIDRNLDGEVQDLEWGSNGWGGGQGMTLGAVSEPLRPGSYRIRVQYEDGMGGNGMVLCWDDATRSAGVSNGSYIIPAAAFVLPDQLVLTAGEPITIAGEITGRGTLLVDGAQATLAVPWTGQVTLREGRLTCAAVGVLDRAEVSVGTATTLACAAFDQRPLGLFGPGTVALGGATLGFADPPTGTVGPRLVGPGRLRKSGDALLRCLGPVDPGIELAIEAGALSLADGRLLAVIALRAPLTTRLEFPQLIAGARVVQARVIVPPGMSSLGIGAFAADRHGRWYQRVLAQPLRAGAQDVTFAIAADQPLSAEPAALAWDASAAQVCDRSGLFLWADAPGGTVRLECRLEAAPTPPRSAVVRLGDLQAPTVAQTGERWEAACRPQPFPSDPYDAAKFSLDLVVTAADGVERRMPGFYAEPMRSTDRGDRDAVEPSGAGTFRARWRPGSPGRYRVRLEARWGDGRLVRSELPAVEVSGARWDGYVRVDQVDPRFFAVNGAFYWPIGLNIRSITDSRSLSSLGTAPTPLRGTLAYDAYLDRFAAAGGNAIEIWLAAWNLGLEWRAEWDGFHGVGRYHQANAWRLDHVLDAAWARGIRVNLVINNHGQGSNGSDPEWEHSPYNRINGGRLTHPSELFHDAWALAGQEQMRRYLVARYADHPAVLGWKLWSEVNLTAAREWTAAWHEQAAARWRALDSYGHPCTTHWSGDWGVVDPSVARLPDLGYLCIDAYHGDETSIAELLWRSTEGLRRFGKPVLVTEYGGSWSGTSHAQMEAALACAGWVGLVSGHAGAPMLWWWEWVDQGERWGPYRAIAAFVRGEDLRHPNAAARILSATSPGGQLWCRAWSRPGRLLGYCCDPQWVRSSLDRGTITAARIDLGRIAAGAMTVAWWDADRGVVLARESIVHPGGPLVLNPPAFARHIGFKLVRE